MKSTKLSVRMILRATEMPRFFCIMRLSKLSCNGGGGRGRPGIGGGFELRRLFLLNCPSPGQLPLVKRVSVAPHLTRDIGQMYEPEKKIFDKILRLLISTR